MCRGGAVCEELGDRTSWSDHAPLPPPEWIRSQLPLVTSAFAFAAAGEAAQARATLARIDDARIRDWCVEHGQMSGRIRLRSLGYPRPTISVPGTGPRNPGRTLETSVLERDQYQCRYCGLHVIPRRLFVALGAVVGA